MTQWVGCGGALGEGHGVFDLLYRGCLHRLILAIVEYSGLEQLVPVSGDRVMLRDGRELGPIALGIALKVAPETQRVHLDERRAAARARACNGLASRSVDSLNRVVLNAHAGYAVCRRAVGVGGDGRGFGSRHG